MVDYSALVADQAKDYNDKLLQEQKDREEAKHFSGLDEEAMIQLYDDISPKNTELLQTLSKAGLTDDQIQFLTQMTESGEAPDQNLLNQLEAIAGGAEIPAAAAQDLASLPSASPDDMKEVSESVAKAAEKITNENAVQEESEVPLESDDNIQLKSSTRESASIDEAIKEQVQKKHKKGLTTLEETKQFEKDKQSALEEGYTEDQAQQYALQEQQLRKNQSSPKKEGKKIGAKKEGRRKDVTLVADPAQDTVSAAIEAEVPEETAATVAPASGKNYIPPKTQNEPKNVEN